MDCRKSLYRVLLSICAKPFFFLKKKKTTGVTFERGEKD